MFEDTAEARLRCSSISLEDGTDEACLNGEPIGFRDGEMTFPSRWRFDPGTTLAMTLEICGTGERTRAEAVVIDCEQKAERLWIITVLFLEAGSPCGIRRAALSEFRESSISAQKSTEPAA